MRKIMPILALMLVLLALTSVRAQDKNPEVVVTHSITQNTPDGLQLQVYFTVRDKEGRPVAPTKISAGKMILREDRTPDIVTLSDPNTPIKIALVLDASGSMQPVAEQLRNAAVDSIDKAPAEAQFGVYLFSDVPSTGDFKLGLDFTSDREAVKQYIREQYNPQNLAPTCLYNVTYRVAQLMQSTLQPEERRAMILFTDGKDDRGGGVLCSDRSLEDAIREAAPDVGASTPVYTIGLCRTANDCSNLDVTVLQRLSTQTRAGYVTGIKEQLTSAFFQIMDDIRSQKLATVTVLACEEGQATLAVSVIGVGDNVAGVVPFPPEHPCYAPTATVELSVQNQDEKKYDFLINARNNSPVAIQQFQIKVLDPDNTLVYSTVVSQTVDARQTANNIPIQVPVDNFKQEGEYRLQAFAVDANNITFRADSDKERRETILAQYQFKYTPPVKSVQVQIISQPSVQYDTNSLEIKELRITDNDQLLEANKKFLKYQLSLFDGETSVFQSQEHNFDLDEPAIKLNLSEIPANLIPTDKTRRYNVKVKLLAPNIESESPPFSFDFPVRTEPTIFQKYGIYIASILGVALLGALLAFMLKRRKSSRPLAIEKPKIYSPPTGMLDQSMLSGVDQSPPQPSAPRPPVQQQPAQQWQQPAQPPAWNQPAQQPVQPAQQWQQPPPVQPAQQPPVQPVQPSAQQRPPAAPTARMPTNVANDPTMFVTQTQPTVRLRVVETPYQQQQMEWTISAFPCRIGRNAAEDVVIDGDKSVSRHHALITQQGSQLFISDDGSNYGVHINRIRQPDKTPVPIVGRVIVRIGQATVIELEAM